MMKVEEAIRNIRRILDDYFEYIDDTHITIGNSTKLKKQTPEPDKKIEHIEEMTVYRRYGNVPALWQLFDKVNELVDSNNSILDELRGKQ